MQKISLTTQSVDGAFEVPFSTGYQTYSGLLSVLDGAGDRVADELHSAPFSGMSNSGLLGWFDLDADREYHKTVKPDTNYRLHLGVTHPKNREAFEALVRAFVIKDHNLPLAHGELTVEEVSTERTSQQELLDDAASLAETASGVRMKFRSTTCRERYDGVWEAHPDRVRLFQHLSDRWNVLADREELELSPTGEALGRGLFTRVDTTEYDTHSIVVHRQEPENADQPSIAADGGHLDEAQGFTGEWEFRFKEATEATRTTVIALANFAEYAGVGRHNARGAGSVETEVIGDDI